MTEWKTIESAPRDREVLLWVPAVAVPYMPEFYSAPAYCISACWDSAAYGWWSSVVTGDREINPTHWMPLPEPPK